MAKELDKDFSNNKYLVNIKTYNDQVTVRVKAIYKNSSNILTFHLLTKDVGVKTKIVSKYLGKEDLKTLNEYMANDKCAHTNLADIINNGYRKARDIMKEFNINNVSLDFPLGTKSIVSDILEVKIMSKVNADTQETETIELIGARSVSKNTLVTVDYDKHLQNPDLVEKLAQEVSTHIGYDLSNANKRELLSLLNTACDNHDINDAYNADEINIIFTKNLLIV